MTSVDPWDRVLIVVVKVLWSMPKRLMMRYVRIIPVWLLAFLIGAGLAYGLRSLPFIHPKYTWGTAKGPSMEPTVHDGDLLIIKPIITSELTPGDIVAFRIGERFVSHRIKAVLDIGEGQTQKKWLITKGDAADQQDPPIPVDRLLGKVTMVVPRISGPRRHLPGGIPLTL